MRPGANFRLTDKNVEQVVIVKDAAPPAILPFGKLSANDRYSRPELTSSAGTRFRRKAIRIEGDGEAM
jgi:hypothetical protein